MKKCEKERMEDKYCFNISLSVLNHLGRNLYRNIITIIGEAVSNSWDADASNVWINIDKDHNNMMILDDGVGMTSDDFQNKFLKIGYSKRKNGKYKSDNGRPFIGRKGIGKLALLSCADSIQIVTKAVNSDFVGGTINNRDLDQAIIDDTLSQDYTLGDYNQDLEKHFINIHSGTLIYFDNITDGVSNTIEYLRKAIALYFRFSLYDESFRLYVNNEEIGEEYLKDFAENTQFLWKINGFNDPLFMLMREVQVTKNVKSNVDIKGYIASVKKPSNLKIRGSQEKASIDLFVNGRLREKDILRHIPTARIVESYVYGQIHFDSLDDGLVKDVFTSSREGIVSGDPKYEAFLIEVGALFRNIIDEWDKYRLQYGDDGDPDNKTITKKQRRARELFNATLKEIEGETKVKKDGLVEKWANELAVEAQFNIPSYTECFISENILRKYIKEKHIGLSKEAIKEAGKWRDKEKRNKGTANISYDIRISNEDIYYLDMDSLANLVDKPKDQNKEAGIGRSAKIYKPIRDAVGHTSIVTKLAKDQLTIVFENIKARLRELLNEIDN